MAEAEKIIIEEKITEAKKEAKEIKEEMIHAIDPNDFKALQTKFIKLEQTVTDLTLAWKGLQTKTAEEEKTKSENQKKHQEQKNKSFEW